MKSHLFNKNALIRCGDSFINFKYLIDPGLQNHDYCWPFLPINCSGNLKIKIKLRICHCIFNEDSAPDCA